MERLRALIVERRHWWALLVACSLAVRLIVPAGFMPVMDGGRVTLQICSGMISTGTMAAMPGMRHGKSDLPAQSKVETPCAFAGIGLAALGAADPVLLLAAVLFAFLLASRVVPQVLPAPPGRLRPPLRAPPLIP